MKIGVLVVALCAVKMGVYKRWDCSRQLKKSVCATTLDELKNKGIIMLLKSQLGTGKWHNSLRLEIEELSG